MKLSKNLTHKRKKDKSKKIGITTNKIATKDLKDPKEFQEGELTIQYYNFELFLN